MTRVTDFEKTQPNLKVTLDLDNQLTWGELFRFVDLARSAGYLAQERVGIENDPNESLPVVVGLSLYLHPDDVTPTVVPEDGAGAMFAAPVSPAPAA